MVGETHYAKAIRALFGSDFDPRGTDLTIAVQLIPDSSNRHDRNAVGVWSGTSLLGHLPRPEAARYAPVLGALYSRGLLPEVNARITGREWGAADGRPAAFDSTIRLDLAEPHMLVPANAAPEQEHRLLPAGSAVQVIGQQQALDVLGPLLRPEGECWAYVTLHEMADHLVEVRLGDTRVGDLSPKMSSELSPVLRHLAERGLVTAARAVVKGNSGKTEVMLYIARVQDLPESWQAGPSRPATMPPAGRGAASVPVPGVTGIGAATPGPVPVSPSPPLAPSPPPVPSAPLAPVPAGASAVPGLNLPGGVMTGGPASGGLVPNWVTPADALPSWASPPPAGPPVAPLSRPTRPVDPVSPGVPASATGSPAVPSAEYRSLAVPSVAPRSPAVPPEAVGTSAVPAGPGSPAVRAGTPPVVSAARTGAGQPAWNNVSPPAWNAGSYPTPYVAGPRFESPATRPVRPSEVPGPLLTDPSIGVHPVSPAPRPHSATPEDLAIAETTVIPALTAVVKAHPVAPVPVSAAPAEGNQHPPIPSAPTGIRFVVPPGWPLPPDGWYPPEDWRPDPAWPLAPPGWQWWVPAWD